MFTRFAFLVLFFAAPVMAADLDLAKDLATGKPGEFAEAEIRREAAAKGLALGTGANATRIRLTAMKEGAPESYSIRVKDDNGQREITVVGADEVGAMYGGLDIAEAIRLGTLNSVKSSDNKPHIARRGIRSEERRVGKECA